MIHPKYNTSKQILPHVARKCNRFRLQFNCCFQQIQTSADAKKGSLTLSCPSFLAELHHLFFLLMLTLSKALLWVPIQLKETLLVRFRFQVVPAYRRAAEQNSNQKEQTPFSESPYLCWLRATVKLQPKGRLLSPLFCTSALKTLLLDSFSQQYDNWFFT